MSVRTHQYKINVEWTGNRGSGTANYSEYDRSHRISVDGKAAINGSSDSAFRGDSSRWNPEELFVSSLSTCHMLWYLHLCADAGLVVTAYNDHAEGTMQEEKDGSGRFTRVVLRPYVTFTAGANLAVAHRLHEAAHKKCFIANSVKCEVACEPLHDCEPESEPSEAKSASQSQH